MSQHKLLAEALRLGFGSAKEMAAAGNISVHTATRYRRGETYPDVFTLARLMRHSRVVAEAMLRMAGLDDLSLDQEQARLVRSLAQLEARRATRHADLATAYAVAGVSPPSRPGTADRAGGAAAAAADRPANGAAAPQWPAK
jgi:hypothetical protein